MVSSEGTEAASWMNLFNNIVKAQDKYLTNVPVTWCPVVCVVLAVTSALRWVLTGSGSSLSGSPPTVLRQSLTEPRAHALARLLAVKAPQIKFLEMKVSCQSWVLKLSTWCLWTSRWPEQTAVIRVLGKDLGAAIYTLCFYLYPCWCLHCGWNPGPHSCQSGAPPLS